MNLNQISLRAARNGLIDLLEIGDSYPIRDLKVEAENSKVAYGQIGRVKLYQSQKNINYALYKFIAGQYNIIDSASKIPGTGETITIDAGPIKDDTIFAIKALKEINHRLEEILLLQNTEIQVGMDSTLKVYISGPSLIDYSTPVKVIIEKSQEGVNYELLDEKGQSLSDAIPGTTTDLVLNSVVLREDTNIRISATKVFEFEEKGTEVSDKPAKKKKKIIKNEEEKILLDTILAIQVRPNTKTIVTVGNPVIDLHTLATLVLDNAQTSVTYEVFATEVMDRDFVYDLPVDLSGILTITTSESSDARVNINITDSKLSSSGRKFESIGKFKGKDGQLTIAPDALFTEDTLFVIKATKTGTDIQVQLETRAAVLVRPDKNKEIVKQSSGESLPLVIVKDSQPGVKYQLVSDKKPLSVPVYHHKNKGLETARLERDFILDSYESVNVELRTIESLDNKSLKVVATKIYSGVTVEIGLK